MTIALPIEVSLLAQAFEAVLDVQPEGRWTNAAWKAYKWLASRSTVTITDSGELEVASERWRKLSPEEKSVTPRYHKANVHFCQCKGYEKGMELRAEPFPCWHRQAANIVEEYVNVLRRAYGEQTVGIPSLAAQENPQATPHATTSTTSHTPHATSFTTIATRPVDSAVPDYMADLYPD